MADIRTAIDNAYGTASTNVDDALDLTAVGGDDLGVTGFANRSTSVQDQLISEGVEAAQKIVTDAQAEVATGVVGALNTVEARVTGHEAALKAEAAAVTTFNGELARFNAANELTTGTDAIIKTGEAGTVADGDNLQDTADPANVLATFTNGEWVPNESFPNFADLSGVNALATDGNELALANNAADASLTALQNAVVRVAQLEQNDDTVEFGDLDEDVIDITEGNVTVDFDANDSNDAPNAQALLDARGALSALNEAVEAFEATRALNTEADDLAEAVTDAQDAITDSEEDGGLNVSLLTVDGNDIDQTQGTVTFSGDDEVYLYNAEDADDTDGDIDVSGFAVTGEDRIFFGDDYSLVQLDGEWDATESTGDASALEIFWEQNGSTLTLYVENKAFAGNGTTDGDITEIALTGVNANDIDFSGGYLTAGEPA